MLRAKLLSLMVAEGPPETVPAIDKAWPSFSIRPPLAAKLPRVAIWLVPVRLTVVPPPVSVLAVSVPVSVMAPAVRLTVVADRLPGMLSAKLPALIAADVPPATMPDTDKASPSFSVRPPVAVKLPNVAIWFAALPSVRLPTEPIRVGTLIAPLACDAAPEVSRSNVADVVTLPLKVMLVANGPALDWPRRMVPAVISERLPGSMPRPVAPPTSAVVLAVVGPSATRPVPAPSDPPRPKLKRSVVMAMVWPLGTETAPLTTRPCAAASARVKPPPVTAMAPRLEMAFA